MSKTPEVVREISTGLFGLRHTQQAYVHEGMKGYSIYTFKFGDLVLCTPPIPSEQWSVPSQGSNTDKLARLEFDTKNYEAVDLPTLAPMVKKLKIEAQKRLEEKLRMFPND